MFVVFISFLVMNTASDRGNYIELFNSPFSNGRIEIVFQYYMNLFNILNIPAKFSIAFTSAIIYFLLSKFWLKFFYSNWFFSVLIFNFIVFSILNYYLGTSIRMGLAMSLSLFFSLKILNGKLRFIPLFLLTFLVHYGAILFVLVFSWVFFYRELKVRYHIFIAVFSGFFLLISFKYLLPFFPFPPYYMQYLNSGFGKTDRFLPFTIIFSLFSLFFIFIKYKVAIFLNKNLYLLSIYTIPFLILIVFNGNLFFAKMLIPLIFVQSLLLSLLYYKLALTFFGANLFLLLLCALNVFSILYALKMYNFI